MKLHVFEAHGSGGNWGKFAVAQYGPDERAWTSALPEQIDVGHQRAAAGLPPIALLTEVGWDTTYHVWVFDLQTGEAAIFRHGGYAVADLEKTHTSRRSGAGHDHTHPGSIPAGDRGMSDTIAMPPVDEKVLHAGLSWLLDTVQPDAAIMSHHGESLRAAQGKLLPPPHEQDRTVGRAIADGDLMSAALHPPRVRRFARTSQLAAMVEAVQFKSSTSTRRAN